VGLRTRTRIGVATDWRRKLPNAEASRLAAVAPWRARQPCRGGLLSAVRVNSMNNKYAGAKQTENCNNCFNHLTHLNYTYCKNV
jgi:hypothetical protein